MIRKPFHQLFERIRRYRQFFHWWHNIPRIAAYAKRLPLTTRMKCFRKGFFANKIQLYPLDKYDWSLFMSDRQMLSTARINGEFNALLDDKEKFSLVMQRFAKVPRIFAVVRNGKLMWCDGTEEKKRSVIDLIGQEKRVFVKPIYGSGGKHAWLLEHGDNGYLQNGQIVDPESLERQILESGSVLISEYIQQGTYASRLFPGAVNTIRMLTLLDPASRIPFIAAAVQRMGRADCAPVDNVSAGGLLSQIDLETGRLGPGSAPRRLPFRWLDRHPDTGVVFEDQVVPNWDAICSEVLGLAASFPLLPHIAWDIAVLDDGIVIIEANGWTDFAVFQLKEPLLADSRIRAFYEYHGVV